jgi:predicted RNA binding protein YcfA (HicA-like mRNA interferase family)
MPVKVKAVLARLKAEGWYEVVTEGSHRQLKHPTKPGKVTVAGKPSMDIAPGTYNSIKQQAGWKETVSEETEEQA